MSFLQGFVTGFSRSADTAIQKYLESDNQLKNRLAEKRIARAETEEARFRKEFDEYKRDIKSLAKKAGGVDNAQYILDLYGYDEGKKTIDDLYQNAKQQITQTMTGRKRKKALELLELQYMAVIDNVTGG